MTPEAILEGIARKRLSRNEFLVNRPEIKNACRALFDSGWQHLSLITGIDWQDRWEVLYHIAKTGSKEVVVLRVTLPYHDPHLQSVTSIWKGAGWHERETYDLLGIVFEGNPDLRRILLPEHYEGHPLRKEVLHGNRS